MDRVCIPRNQTRGVNALEFEQRHVFTLKEAIMIQEENRQVALML